MDNELTLKDYPVLTWLLSAMAFGYGAYQALFHSPPRLVNAAAGFLVGFALLAISYTLTVTADKSTRLLTLEYRSLLFHSLKEIRFDDIQTIRVDSRTSRDSDGTSVVYCVAADLKNGETIPFRSYYSSGTRGKQKTAERLRVFIGLSEGFDETPQGIFRAMPKIGAQAAQEFIKEIGAGEMRETKGVRWQMQPIGVGASPAMRWFSPDFKTQGGFLYLAQKAEGQSSSGFLASASAMLFRQSLSLYGFSEAEAPDKSKAQTYEALSPALAKHFMAFTTDPAEARQILNPWMQQSLAEWGERHPLKQFQTAAGFSQVVALFSPQGVFLATPSTLNPDEIEELAALGVEMAKSQGARSG